MRALRWMLLPVVVIGCGVGVFVLFYRIYSYVVNVCAARYALDFRFCPAPWAPAVFSVLFCLGSIIGAVLCVAAAYAAAPGARCRAIRVTAIILALLAIYLFFIHWRWELLLAVIAAFAASFLICRHHLRSTPHT